MSAINGNDPYDDVKKMREYYKKREADLKAKHAKEKEKLTESYRSDLSKTESTHQKELKRRNQAGQGAMSKSDMKYTNDIEKLKSLHNKQLKENRETQAAEEAKYKKEYKKNIERNDNMLRSQLSEKEQSYQKTLQERELASQEAYARQSQKADQALRDQKGKLERDMTEKHDVSLKNQRKTNEMVSREYDNYRSTKENETKKTQRKHNYQLETAEEKYQRLLTQKDRDQAAMLEEMRELSRDGIAHEKRNMHKQIEKERQGIEKAREDLEIGRNAKQIDHLKYQLEDAKKQNQRDLRKSERAKNREVENVKIAYQDNVDSLQKERSAQLALHQKIRSEQAIGTQKQSETKIKEAHDFFNDHLMEESDRHDAQVARLQRQFSKDSIQKQAMLDHRFRKIQDDYVKDRNNLQKQHARNVDSLRGEQQKVLHSERSNHALERDGMQERFQTQIAEMQQKHETDIYEMQQRYEGMLSQLREDYQTHLNGVEEKNKTQNLNEQKNQELAIKQKEQQFEYRLKKIEEAYNENLKRINGRHEENIKSLSQAKTAKSRYV